jgi:hypothetical protein
MRILMTKHEALHDASGIFLTAENRYKFEGG